MIDITIRFRQIFYYHVRVFRIDMESTTQLDVLHDKTWQRVSKIFESYSRFHYESNQLKGYIAITRLNFVLFIR
jgi:hypothetical protein